MGDNLDLNLGLLNRNKRDKRQSRDREVRKFSEFDKIVMRYTAKGYKISYQTSQVVQLIKPKKVSGWAFLLLFLFGIIAFAGYFISYFAEKDKILTLYTENGVLVKSKFQGGTQTWADIIAGIVVFIGLLINLYLLLLVLSAL